MKSIKAILTGIVLLVAISTQAQSLHKVVPRGSNVFVIIPGQKNWNTATEKLNQWAYWHIVKNRDDADFSIKFTLTNGSGIRNRGGSASAEFINKKNETVFMTKNVALHNDGDAIKQLIEVRMMKDKN